MKKFILFFLLGLVGLWVLGIVLVNVFDVDLDKYFNPGPSASPSTASSAAPATNLLSGSSDAKASGDWKTFKYDKFHCSIESPCEMKEMSVSKEAPTNNLQAMSGCPEKKIMVVLTAIEAPNNGLDLDKLMEQQVKMFQLMNKIFKGLQLTTEPVTLSNTPGLMARGTYQMGSQGDWEMKTFKFKKGSSIIDLTLQYAATDECRASADRVIHSLAFTD